MKFVLAGIIVVGCTYIGIILSARYRRREQTFAETLVFLDSCKSQISFRRLPLMEILAESLKVCTSPFYGLLATFYNLLAENRYVDYSALEANLKCPVLRGEELKAYVQLFGLLGKSDAASQLQSLEEFSRTFQGFHAAAAEEKKRFSGMYTKLGVLCGLGLSVLVF